MASYNNEPISLKPFPRHPCDNSYNMKSWKKQGDITSW